MSFTYLMRALWGVALLLASGLSLADSKQPSDNPLDAASTVPVPVYPASLQTFKTFDETTRSDWTDANRTVHEIGGWRAYSKMQSEDAKKRGHEHAH